MSNIADDLFACETAHLHISHCSRKILEFLNLTTIIGYSLKKTIID